MFVITSLLSEDDTNGIEHQPVLYNIRSLQSQHSVISTMLNVTEHQS